jgi:poly(3-hydroxybutyrate) depolymerase
MKIQLVALISVMLCAGRMGFAQAAESPQHPRSFSKEITRMAAFDYLLYLPPGYEESPDAKWPMILFLHGSGERGHDVDAVKMNGLPRNLEDGTNLPFIVVSPQCPKNMGWNDSLMTDGLNALLDQLISKYRIDEDRIYLTGLSMGGSGVWALGARSPERFAALAPVCGHGDGECASQLRLLPIWVFHGALDDVVKPEESQNMVDAVKKAGGDIKFTLYPDANHNSWTVTYNNPELYEWFLSHKRRPKFEFVDLTGATATASTGNGQKAIDGDSGTRWESEWTDPQWLQIDLGEPTAIRQVVVRWENAYAKAYDLLASADGETWTTVFTQKEGDGVVDVIPVPGDVQPRYLKLVCKERSTQWGDSIWEIELEK